jgi:N-acetylglutamate synthase
MSRSFNDGQIRSLEEITLTAWPALQAVYDDGWVLRFAEGYTRRANSVNPLYPSLDDLPTKIARCETFYTSRGLPTVFKLTPASQELDELLASCGYTAEAPTSTQISDLAQVDFGDIQYADINHLLTDEWLAAFCRLNSVQDRYLAPMRRMLPSIAPSTAYASIRREGEIVAVGLGVYDRGYVGLFDIVADSSYRRQGLGLSIISNLMLWGKENSAQQAYLQVMTTNEPALRLYERLGFHEVYPYWYRTKR